MSQAGSDAITAEVVEPAARPLRVLFSFDNVGAATINPFTDMLFDSIRAAGSRPLAFSWGTALVGRYDVLHLHWPENHLRADRWYLRLIQYLLFTAVLLRVRLARIPLAQTQHNPNPHEAGRLGERAILNLANRWTRLWIRLVDELPVPANVAPTALRRTIPHGTYSDRYHGTTRPEQRRGRLLFFGLIRPYKGVSRLLPAFSALPDAELELRICGQAQDGELAREIVQATERDRRVSARLDFLPEPELIAELAHAELVVLPYEEMNNSGAAILALSVDRPVIVPNGEVTRRLESDAGRGWVVRYDGQLTTAKLGESIRRVRELQSARSGPGLQTVSWAEIGALHIAAYRDVLPPGRS